VKLPGGSAAIVEISKVRDYILNPHHPRGRHKARVFSSALGLTQVDAEFLRSALIQAARDTEAIPGCSDDYGQRFTLDFEFSRGNRRAKIRSA
jgi:hypothetical protein